jgi:putative transposase
MARAIGQGSSQTDGLDRKRANEQAQPVAKGGKLVRNQRSHARENRHVDDVRRLKTLEAENAKLKRLLAEQLLANEVLKEVAAKKW